MSTLLLLTSARSPPPRCCPPSPCCPTRCKILPAEGSALLEAPDVDLVLVDGRKELAHARDLCRLIRTTGVRRPRAARRHRGRPRRRSPRLGHGRRGAAHLGPAELEARLRLAIGRLARQRDADDPEAHVIRSGEVVVDDSTYTAKLGGRRST